MTQTDSLDRLIDQNMVKSAGGILKFTLPKGNDFKVNIIFHSSHKGRENVDDQNIRSKYHGTYITITHHGRKLPIGSRRWYKTREDADLVAKIWNEALAASDTRWDITAEVTTREEQKDWEKRQSI